MRRHTTVCPGFWEKPSGGEGLLARTAWVHPSPWPAIVYAADDATFSDPHLSGFAVPPGDGGALLWPARIGLTRAREFLLTDRVAIADEAVEIGLINKRPVPAESLDAEVDALVAKLKSYDTFALEDEQEVAQSICAAGSEHRRTRHADRRGELPSVAHSAPPATSSTPRSRRRSDNSMAPAHRAGAIGGRGAVRDPGRPTGRACGPAPRLHDDRAPRVWPRGCACRTSRSPGSDIRSAISALRQPSEA